MGFVHLFFTLHFQEYGLARFKTSATKTMKGFEYVLGKMQGKLLFERGHIAIYYVFV